MSIQEMRRAATALFVAALLIAGGSAAYFVTAPARAAADRAVNVDDSTTVQVTAEPGFSFTPSGFSNVATNTTVTVTFTDVDNQPHTFYIIGKQGWVIPTDASSTEIDSLAFGTSPAALVGTNDSASGSPGDITTVTFHSPGVGWYEFLCTEPGHFQSGMYGFIAFGEALPPNLTVTAAATDPGVAVFIIVGTIVSLVVIALVLGFYVGRRRGSEFEMPPQRLGYPEPEPAEGTESPPLPPEPRG